MRSSLRSILAVALLVSAVSQAHAAGKTTLDPNTVPKQTEAPAVEIKDPRLDQKIEYDAGNARLHTAIADLAKMSGVTIHCGTGTDDWRVRDIPITIAARGITLRKLLDYIAASTHTLIRTAKLNDEITYRIIQDPKMEKAIADYNKAVKDYELASARWCWDVAAKLKDIPASEIKAPTASPDKWWDKTWWDGMATQIEASKLLAAIDPAMRERLMSGEKITLSPATAPAGLRNAILSAIKTADTQYLRDREAIASDEKIDPKYKSDYNTDPASSAQLEDSAIKISRDQVEIAVRAPIGDFDPAMPRVQRCQMWEMAKVVEDNNKGRLQFAKKPSYPKQPESELLRDALKLLAKDTTGLPEKVTIKFEDDKKPKSFADALILISKATGITIVSEDFQSHYKRDIRTSVGGDCAFKEALDKSLPNTRWYTDAQAKTVVGCGMRWTYDHECLMPERVITDLQAKANGDGIHLEDLTPLTAYSSSAILNWLNSEPDFQSDFISPFSTLLASWEKDIWAFYDSLRTTDKALALSKSGLKLDAFDPKLIAKLIAVHVDSGVDELWHPKEPATIRQLADPAVIPTLTLRITRNEVDIKDFTPLYELPSSQPTAAAKTDSPASETKSITIPQGYGKRCHYYMQLEGVVKGNMVSTDIQGFSKLPFFSPKREKELAEAWKKAEGQTK